MMHWISTLILVLLSYWLGYRHGWRKYERSVMKALKHLADKLGAPKNNPFWNNHHE